MKRHKRPTKVIDPPSTEPVQTDVTSGQNSEGTQQQQPQTMASVAPEVERVREEPVSKAFLEEILGSLKAIQERQNKQEEQMLKLTQTNQGQGNQMFQIPQELMMKLLLK